MYGEEDIASSKVRVSFRQKFFVLHNVKDLPPASTRTHRPEDGDSSNLNTKLKPILLVFTYFIYSVQPALVKSS